jgi:hypothetical protein
MNRGRRFTDTEYVQLEDYFTNTLRHPLSESSGCALLIERAPAHIYASSREEADWGAPKSWSSNLSLTGDSARAVIRFFIAQRSPQEFKALEERLTNCRCDFTIPLVKHIHVFIMENPSTWFIKFRNSRPIFTHSDFKYSMRVLLKLIADTILGFREKIHPPNWHELPQSENMPNSAPWPISQDDYLQGQDPATFIDSLVSWCKVDRVHASAASAIGVIVDWRLEVFAPHMHRMTGWWRFIYSVFDSLAMWHKSQPDQWLAQAQGWAKGGIHYVFLLDVMGSLAALNPSGRKGVFHGMLIKYGTPLAEQMLILIPLCERYHAHIKQTGEIHGISFANAARALTCLRDYVDMWGEVIQAPEQPFALDLCTDIAERLYLVLIFAKNSRVCVQSDCRLRKGGKRCQSCGVVKYCSMEVSCACFHPHYGSSV